MKRIDEVMSQQPAELRQQVNVPVKLTRRPNPPKPEAVVEAFRIANALKAMAEHIASMSQPEREAVMRACAVVGVTVPEVKP